MFTDLEASCFDQEWFVLVCHESNIAIHVVSNEPNTVLELSFHHDYSIADLDLELRVISDGLQKCFVV